MNDVAPPCPLLFPVPCRGTATRPSLKSATRTRVGSGRERQCDKVAGGCGRRGLATKGKRCRLGKRRGVPLLGFQHTDGRGASAAPHKRGTHSVDCIT